MFGLIGRGELDKVAEDEFEHLTTRLKNLWLGEHNEDGTHTDAVALTASVNVFHENQVIDSFNPELQLVVDGGDAKARFASYAENEFVISRNLSYNGITWDLDDVNADGFLIRSYASNGCFWEKLAAGASPAPTTTVMQLGLDGVLHLGGFVPQLEIEKVGGGSNPSFGRFLKDTGTSVGITHNIDSNGAGVWNLDSTSAVGTGIFTNETNPLEVYHASAGSNPRTFTNVFNVSSTGLVDLLSGQIKFPASQNASANANTLDDYEEGTWTPTIAGSGGQSGQAYTDQIGRYVKIGKFVYATGRITLSTLGTITGNVLIGGLPYTVENVTSLNSVSPVWFFGITTALVNMLALTVPNSTTAQLYKLAAAATNPSSMVQGDFANTSILIFTFVYRASD